MNSCETRQIIFGLKHVSGGTGKPYPSSSKYTQELYGKPYIIGMQLSIEILSNV